MGNYRLCRVTAAEPSEDECVRTVTVGYLPRKSLKQTVYRPVPLETKEVAIQRLVLLVPVEEQQLDEQAPATYANHYLELSLDKQPRAQRTTPSRSLPPTRRPARAGGQCRAGLSNRLAKLSSVLCLTSNLTLCANPETDEIYNEVLPENVVVPLSYSGPLSMPSALPQYEVTTRVPFPSEKFNNEVLPKDVVVPLSYSGPLSMPSALSQYEATSRTLSLSEPKYKKASQNESNYKKTSQDEPKYKKVSLNEKTYKKDFQNESKLVLESELKETKEIGLPSGFSASITKALSGVMYLMKMMIETFRPGAQVAGIFKHLPPECQRNYEGDGFSVEDELSLRIGPMNNAWHECAGQEVVSKSRVCASRKSLQSQKSREFHEGFTHARLFNNLGTTAMIEALDQISFWK